MKLAVFAMIASGAAAFTATPLPKTVSRKESVSCAHAHAPVVS